MESKRKKIERYKLLKKLGEGTYGKVYKALDLKTNKKVALKKIILEDDGEGIPSTALREIAMLKKLKHPNIIKLLEVIHFSKNLILIFELLEMDLKDYLRGIELPIDMIDVKKIMYQILIALERCHSQNIIHRDLKPQNIFLNAKDLTTKLGDFGLARFDTVPMKGYTHEVITLWYRPPEVLLGKRDYKAEIDIWSVGCIMAEIINLHPIFIGKDEESQVNSIFSNLGLPTIEEWPDMETLPSWDKIDIKLQGEPVGIYDLVPSLDGHGMSLLEGMLTCNPNDRITAKEAIMSEWFDEVRTLYK